MTPHFSKVHNHFKLNGIHYNSEGLKTVAYSLIKEGEPFEVSIGNFLLDWLDTKDYIIAKTSGSTGTPKAIKLPKQAMVNSAIATGDFFKLESGNSALLCLPCTYIAGKMMLVRALILGLALDYVQPTATPKIKTNKTYHFCAMVPLQLANVIDQCATIKQLIVGGSKVEMSLLKQLKNKPLSVCETYGMTETITHVAVKPIPTKIQKGSDYFKALPKVQFAQDKRNCLIINAPHVLDEAIITNDVVELKSKTEFYWLGRYDNVINSGSIKLYPEQIEQKLKDTIKERFIVSSEPDNTLGEQLIVIIENPSESIEFIFERVKSLKTLTKFEVPRKIYNIPKFPETASGKIQRQKTLKLVIN